jgi:hypothetical protein
LMKQYGETADQLIKIKTLLSHHLDA